MEMKKVLWPTDLSDNAAVALPYVESLSNKYTTEIHVLYVIEELGYHESWYGDFDKSHIDKIHQWEQGTAQKRLDQICENHLKGCPLFIKHVAIGDPAQEILKYIEKQKPDMVVMATHGRKGHFAFGSVTDKVVKSSPVPVVTVPTKTQK
jgi:nucleotide-binding universal stress UspA family protein